MKGLAVVLVCVAAVAVGIFVQWASKPAVLLGTVLPPKMRALHIHAAGDVENWGDLKVEEIDVPQLKDGYVLVKVEAAPVNPSDVIFMHGIYGGEDMETHFPSTCGFEGAGTIVASQDALGRLSLGNRVAFAAGKGGAYAEYVLCKADEVVPLPDEVSFEQGSSAIVNPLTVMGMLHTRSKEGHTGIIHTGAAGALGKMLVRVCAQEKIPLINVVRRADQKELLVREGASPKHVLLSTDPDYPAQLRALAAELSATVAFDAVSGDSPRELMDNMPFGSTVYVYGALSARNVSEINPAELMLGLKSLRGFHLKKWTDSLSFPEKLYQIFKARGLLTSVLKTEYAKEVSLDEAFEAFQGYIQKATNGKILVRPSKKE